LKFHFLQGRTHRTRFTRSHPQPAKPPGPCGSIPLSPSSVAHVAGTVLVPNSRCAEHCTRLSPCSGLLHQTRSDWPTFPHRLGNLCSVLACHLSTPVGLHDISLRTAQTRTRPRRPRPLPPCLSCRPPCPSYYVAHRPTAVTVPMPTDHLP
jgi:hypothetical protein